MIQKVSSFLKKDTVLTIALALAVLSMFIIPPSAGYLEISGSAHTDPALWPDDSNHRSPKHRFLSTARGITTASNPFTQAAGTASDSSVFLSSMLITNDVALITFVPFALELLRMVNRKDRIVPVVVCQTLAANLGSMTTPVGNPRICICIPTLSFHLIHLSGASVHFRCFHWFCCCSSQCLHQGRLSH